MSILRLPNELIAQISDHLDSDFSINALLQTCKRFASLLNYSLYQHNARKCHSSALGWGVLNGIESTVHYSLEAGGSTTEKYAVSSFGSWPAMGVACRLGYGPIVRLLIKYKADLDSVEGRIPCEDHDSDDLERCITSPMVLAVSYGHESIVRLLLSEGASPDITTEKDHITPLRMAVMKGYLHVVKLFRKWGCDLLRGNLLADAAYGGHYDIVSYLIRSLELKDHWQELGYSALCSATDQGDPEIVGLFLDYGVAPTLLLLLRAAKRGNFAAAEELRNSIDLENIISGGHILDKSHQQLYLVSSGCGWDDIIEELLKRGYPPYPSRDQVFESESDGWSIGKGSKTWTHHEQQYGSPLALASHRGHHRVVEKLLSYGGARIVDLQASSYYNIPSPLFFAIEGGYPHIVKMLLDYGANPHFQIRRQTKVVFQDHRGKPHCKFYQESESPFSKALELPQNSQIVQMILNTGANRFEMLDELDKKLILYGALMLGNINMVDFLDGRVPFKDFTAMRPRTRHSLTLAAAHGGLAVMKRLFATSYQADSSTFWEYQQALELAARASNVAAIKLLFEKSPINYLYASRENHCPLLTCVRGDITEISTAMSTLFAYGVVADTHQTSSLTSIYHQYTGHHYSSNFGHVKLEEHIQVLLDHGADPLWDQEGSSDSNTALVDFARWGQTKAIKLMLKALEKRRLSYESWKGILDGAEKAARAEGRSVTAAFLSGYYYRMEYPVPGGSDP